MYDYSAGSYVDSILFVGAVQRETLVLDGTPFPFYRIVYNQVGGTKATSFGVTRTITIKD
jgi:hypothetical protein